MATVYFNSGFLWDPPNFSSFISLWTLSLAPLVAHVIAGVPQRTLLAEPTPSLLQQLVHWNPTSIIWRYFAITDRRVRSKTWDKVALATTNALFWTERGWDGGEGISSRDCLYLTRAPKKTHVDLLSASLPQTIIVTLQGVQALYQLTAGSHNFAVDASWILPTLYVPLALFGLFRLPAAYWLTEDYAFADVRDGLLGYQSVENPLSVSSQRSDSTHAKARSLIAPRGSASHDLNTREEQPTSPLIPPGEQQSFSRPDEPQENAVSHPQLGIFLKPIKDPTTQFHRPSSWRGILMRILFLLLVLGLVAIAIFYDYGTVLSYGEYLATGISMMVFYTFFTVVTATLFFINIVRGASCTTVIPGIDSVWYKLYTCTLFTMAVGMFVVASLEQEQPGSERQGY